VLLNPINERQMRAVTHRDVNRADCESALGAMAKRWHHEIPIDERVMLSICYRAGCAATALASNYTITHAGRGSLAHAARREARPSDSDAGGCR
jgi:hypothetical protein